MFKNKNQMRMRLYIYIYTYIYKFRIRIKTLVGLMWLLLGACLILVSQEEKTVLRLGEFNNKPWFSAPSTRLRRRHHLPFLMHLCGGGS